MYTSSPNVATARLSIRVCGALLKGAAEASISVIRGSGGFSISPKLHCSRIVDKDKSKAFKLVQFDPVELSSISNIRDWQGFIDRKTQELERLFRKGQASPYDVDLRGNTLLHVRGRPDLW